MPRLRQRSIKVLIVDDHRVFAEALAIAVRQDPDIRADVATSGQAAIEAAARLKPEIVLMDVEMPGMDGLVAIRRIHSVAPEASVIVVSAHDEDLIQARAIDAGAAGFIPKLSAMSEVSRAIRLVHEGSPLIEQQEMTRLLRVLRHRRRQESTERQRVGRLTPRQLQILQMLAEGLSPKSISAELGVSPLTLRTHVQNILTRLGVHNKVEAVTMAIKHGKVSMIGPAPVSDRET